jgi:hypothetical protein
MQFIGSAFYVWTYYALIVDSRAPSNIFGFAIGAVSSICDLAFGPMIGGCINPVKYIGPRLVTAELSDPWIYFTAPLLGGVFAGFYFDFFVLERKEKQEYIDEDNPSPETLVDDNDDPDFGTLDNQAQSKNLSKNNSLKKMLFTKNNSENDSEQSEKKENESDDDIQESKHSSELQSKSSFSNI